MSYRAEPLTIWSDRRLVMRRSPIHGTGTFATDEIRAGEPLIWVSGGVVYTTEDWHSGTVQLDPEMYNEARLPDGLLIATPKLFHYYINHSCDPNAIDISHHPSYTHYVAWRDIRADEELTTDYGRWGDDELEACDCGTPMCRGQVTRDDWKLPEVQRRFRGHFPPHIEQRIQRIDVHRGNHEHES